MPKISNPAFELAKQMQDQQKVDAENSKSDFQGGDYEQIKYLSLIENKVKHERVFRIVGYPHKYRAFTDEQKAGFGLEIKPSDAKVVLRSDIVTDTGTSYTKINFPFVLKGGRYQADPEYILTRLFRDVTAGKSVPIPEGEQTAEEKKNNWKYRKTFIHEGKSCLERIKNNKKKGENPTIFRKFLPTMSVVMNVIDRHDDWCINEKHTKLLSQNMYSFTPDGGTLVELPNNIGINEKLYNQIIDTSTVSGGWDMVDMVVKMAETNSVFDCTDVKYIDSASATIGVEGELTAEESAYELYDLDKLFANSRYYKLKKNLEGLFKLVDNELGTKYYEELLELVAEEKLELDAIKEAQKKLDEANAPVDESPKETTETKVDAPVEKAPLRGRTAEPTTDVISDEDWKKAFPSIESVPENELAILKKAVVSITDGVPTYIADLETPPCGSADCGKEFPITIMTCPHCGTLNK